MDSEFNRLSDSLVAANFQRQNVRSVNLLSLRSTQIIVTLYMIKMICKPISKAVTDYLSLSHLFVIFLKFGIVRQKTFLIC